MSDPMGNTTSMTYNDTGRSSRRPILRETRPISHMMRAIWSVLQIRWAEQLIDSSMPQDVCCP